VKNNLSVVEKGSLVDEARKQGKSIAETFLSCHTVIIFDSSGSMSDHDSRGGMSRYDVALEELKNIQASHAGKIGIITFSSTVEFTPSGHPPFLGGGTNLTGALEFAKVADVPGIEFIVISDGCPDDEYSAINVARTYKNKINVVYAGPEGTLDYYDGRGFLKRLAEASGGVMVTADRAIGLESKVNLLLGH